MWNKFRFQGRLFFTISFLFLLIMVIAGIFFYGYLYNTNVHNMKNVFAESNRFTKEKLDDLILKMDALSSQLVANENIQKVFLNTLDYKGENYSYFDLNVSEKIKLNKECVAINTPVDNKYIIHIYRAPNIYYSTNSLASTFSYVCELMQSGQVKTDDNWAQTYYEVINPHQDYWKQWDTETVLSIVRPLISTYSSKMELAMVEVTEDYKKVQNICESNQSLEGARTIVVDRISGEVVYPYDKVSQEEASYYLDLNSLNDNSITEIEGFDGEKQIVQALKCEKSNWSVFLLQPKALFFKPIMDITVLLIVIFLIFFVISVIAIYYVTDRLTRPIRELKNELKDVTLENVDIHIQENTNNEILMLQKHLKDLLNRLQESANTVAKAQSAEYAAKLMALQAQINPHFLYNSLTAISAAGQEAKSDKVQIMCSQLGRLFRYASSDQGNKTLREELDNVQTYLEFSKWRYLDTLEYSMEIDSAAGEIMIPRLLLQPIVENCIVHGYYHVLPPLKIKICCSCNAKYWRVEVSDNGGGISKDVMEELRHLMIGVDEVLNLKKMGETMDIQEKALVNIYARLRLTYGIDACFILNNTEEGLKVTVGGSI